MNMAAIMELIGCGLVASAIFVGLVLFINKAIKNAFPGITGLKVKFLGATLRVNTTGILAVFLTTLILLVVVYVAFRLVPNGAPNPN